MGERKVYEKDISRRQCNRNRSYTDESEDPYSVPSTHLVAHKPIVPGNPSSFSDSHAHVVCKHACRYTHIHKYLKTK